MKPFVSNGIAFSYVRCSTPRQTLGDTKRRQVEHAERYCKSAGLILDSRGYFDLGVSAFRSSHKAEGSEFRALLDAVKAGKIPSGSTLVIENLDRLSRDFITTGIRLFIELLEMGLRIVADNKEYTLESVNKVGATDLLITLLVLQRAHEESATKSKRIREAWKSAQTDALAGKRVELNRCPKWLKRGVSGEWIQISNRVEIVRRIYKEYLAGHGYGSIARGLNRDKLECFGDLHRRKDGSTKTSRWNSTKVKHYLQSQAVIGRYAIGHRGDDGKKVRTGEVVNGFYPAIVSESDWYSVQERLRSHKTTAGKPQREDANLFRGIITCGYCGGTMGVYNAKEGGSFICWNSISGECIRAAYPSEDIELRVISLLPSVLKQWAGNKADTRRLEEARGRLAEVEKKLDSLITLVESGASSETLAKRINELEKEKSVFKEMIQKETVLLEQSEANPRALFRDWTWKTQAEASVEDRLAVVPLLKSAIEGIRVYCVGDQSHEYKAALTALESSGKKGGSVYHTLKKRFVVERRRYFCVSLKRPVVVDGVEKSEVILGRFGIHIQPDNEGNLRTINAFEGHTL